MTWLRRLFRRRARRDAARLAYVVAHGWTPTHLVPDAPPEEWTP